MSNALAIAAVTATLGELVSSAARSAVGGGADVVFTRPRSDPDSSESDRVHLFLYQISPNPAMHNATLPTRSADGRLVQQPAVALDLHYLLAFYGSGTTLNPQRMLGAVVRDLNAKPVLTKEMITDAVGGQSFLQGSDLAASVEKVKFTPLALSLEDLSKLWSVFFQTPYALSVVYKGTVVLIESEESARTPLPVLRRGEQDRGIKILPGPFPLLDTACYGMRDDRILTARPPSFPAAQLGLAVIIRGSNLGGSVFLRFRHSRQELVSELEVTAENRSPGELKVVLPEPATGTTQTDWAPGVYTVTAVKPSATGGDDITSNALPVALAPIIAAIEPNMPIQTDLEGTATITITCQPRVRTGQQVVLLLAGREIAGEIDPGNADKVVFTITNAPKVTDALVRLRVDGIESMPFKRIDIPPPSHFEFLSSGQTVTII